MFGAAFKAVWSVADAGARLTAATVAVGAKVVGQIPVAVAHIENGIRAVARVPGEVVDASQSVVANVRVSATEWMGWMDQKLATQVSKVLPGLDPKIIKRIDDQAVQDAKRDRDSLKNAQEERKEELRQADARRLENARKLREKITDAGENAADAIIHASQKVGEVGYKVARGIDKLAVIPGALQLLAADAVRLQFVKLWDKFTNQKMGGIVQGCPKEKVAERLEDGITRREKVVSAARKKASLLPPSEAAALNKAADELDKNVQASKDLVFASDAYNDTRQTQLPTGWERIENDQLEAELGLDGSMLHPPTSGFRAAVYKDTSKEPPRYVVAFKGTTMTSKEDWKNNGEQDLGIGSDYYDRAIELAGAVKKAAASKGASVSFTGHSLGGGLASAAALSTRLPATTFNPSGVNPATVPFDPKSAESLIDAYQVDGEILTSVQAFGPESAVGKTHSIPGRAEVGIVDRHLAENVMDGMNTEGDGAENEIRDLEDRFTAVVR